MPINCFATTSGSTTVTVNIANHGAINTAYVSFSGATAVGGVPASDLNKEHQVSNVTSSSFNITVSTTASSTVSAGGGSAIIAEFQVNPGLDTVVPGNGWGAGTWGRGTWGSASTSLATSDVLRLWSHDNFGEDLIINIRNGGIFYWDRTNGVSSRAIPLHSLTGADSATPQVAKKVLVSDRDRHVIAFGCDAIGSIGTVDPLLIRFSDQETPTTWLPTATNTAGDLRISSGSEIVTAVETKQQMLVFTDVSLHAMQFLGPPFTFGLGILSENTTIIAPNAAIAVDDIVFWMGEQDFYIYTGAVQKLPCTVLDYVFSDFNLLQKEKVFTAINSSFGEVWWFYPSSTATEIDRYVIYNYLDKIWYFGSLERTAWLDAPNREFPIAAGSSRTDTEGYLFDHENGIEDDTGPMTSFIESADFDLADGDNFTLTRRILPDIEFVGSTSSTPEIDMEVKTRNFPGGSLTSDSADRQRVIRTAVGTYTDQVFVRARARQMALRVESDTAGVQWQLGSPRLDARPDGKR